MAEPATSTAAVIASAMGLTIFGIATGLHPSLLIAGLAGVIVNTQTSATVRLLCPQSDSTDHPVPACGNIHLLWLS